MAKRALLAWLALLSVAGCRQAPDLSAVEAERAKPVQRYDVMQAIVSLHGSVVAGTQDGAVLVSRDAGKSWRREMLAGASLIGLTSCPDGSFLGIDFSRRVWWSDGAGRHWQSNTIKKPNPPLTVACDSHGAWWVGGPRSTIAVSRDHGATWSVTDLGEDVQLTTLQFAGESFGIAIGEFGYVTTTIDGGAAWKPQTPIPGNFYPYSALFADTQKGWVSGIAGQMLTTADGGKSWTPQSNESGSAIYRLFMHQGTPYGVGAGGVVVRLEGDAWRAIAYAGAVPVSLAAGDSLQGSTSIVAGGGGLLRVINTSGN